MIRHMGAGSRLFGLPLVAAFLLATGLSTTLAEAQGASRDRDIDLRSLSGMYLAARIADSARDMTRAAAFYRAAYAADPGNPFLLERALVLSAAEGRIDQAVHYAGLMVKEAPDSRLSRLILAVSKLRGRTYSAAIAELERAGDGVLADLTGDLLGAWALFGQGKVDEALDRIDALGGHDWYESFKLLHSGYIAAAADRADEALRRLAQAHERDSSAVRIVEAYARTLARAGDRAAARKVLADFLERYPRNPLAQAALDAVESDRPVRLAVNTPRQGAAEVLSGVGAAVGQEGGVELGAVYLRLALHLEPQLGGGLAAVALGTLLETNDLGEEALPVFESIAPDAPFRPFAMLRTAVTLDAIDRVEEAEEAFQEALGRDPEDIQAYISYGNMLRGRERWVEAADVYSQAVGRLEAPSRGDWTLFYFRGIAYEREGEWDRAEIDFQRALRLYPDQPLVLNYLGYSWVDMGIRLEEALEMIKSAVEQRPNDGYIVDSLGWAYYKLGRFEEAVEELERAVDLRPQDPIINDHLGDAYWKVGRRLEAQFQWRRARDLGAEEPELEIINRKISTGRLWENEEPAAEESIPEPEDRRAERRGGPAAP